MNDSPLLQTERRGGVVTLTLNRPEKRNALSLSLLRDLDEALRRIGDDASIRVVVLAAQGNVFSSGHDLKEMVGRDEADYQALFQQCSVTMRRLRQIPQPVIARVQGLATAAGCQLAASCDLIVASEQAAFATPGVRIGLFCTTPMVPIQRSLPPKIAMEMLLTGRPLSSRRAHDLGFVNVVAAADQIDAEIADLVAAIVSASPEATARGKRAFYEQQNLAETEAYPLAVDIMTNNALHREAREGIAAFLEKRPADWNVSVSTGTA